MAFGSSYMSVMVSVAELLMMMSAPSVLCEKMSMTATFENVIFGERDG